MGQWQDNLVSRSHKFQTHSPRPQGTEITAFGEDYQQPAATKSRSTVTADPRAVSCITGLAISKQSTSFSIADSKSQMDGVRLSRAESPKAPTCPAYPCSKSVHPDLSGTSMTRFRESQPSHTEGVLNRQQVRLRPSTKERLLEGIQAPWTRHKALPHLRFIPQANKGKNTKSQF